MRQLFYGRYSLLRIYLSKWTAFTNNYPFALLHPAWEFAASQAHIRRGKRFIQRFPKALPPLLDVYSIMGSETANTVPLGILSFTLMLPP